MQMSVAKTIEMLNVALLIYWTYRLWVTLPVTEIVVFGTSTRSLRVLAHNRRDENSCKEVIPWQADKLEARGFKFH